MLGVPSDVARGLGSTRQLYARDPHLSSVTPTKHVKISDGFSPHARHATRDVTADVLRPFHVAQISIRLGPPAVTPRTTARDPTPQAPSLPTRRAIFFRSFPDPSSPRPRARPVAPRRAGRAHALPPCWLSPRPCFVNSRADPRSITHTVRRCLVLARPHRDRALALSCRAQPDPVAATFRSPRRPASLSTAARRRRGGPACPPLRLVPHPTPQSVANTALPALNLELPIAPARRLDNSV